MLSYDDMALEFREKGHEVSASSVRRWCILLGCVSRSRYIKPLLSQWAKYRRLHWVMVNEMVDVDGIMRFTDNLNTVHLDEKWFYLMHNGRRCRVFPDKDGMIKMPGSPKVYHKSRMPKLMFLCACAVPRPCYEFDGKCAIHFFGQMRKAKRSCARTGTEAGVTDVIDTMKIDTACYWEMMRDFVLPAIVKAMWWFGKDAVDADGNPTPEAGTILYIQHDGAPAHTSATSRKEWAKLQTIWAQKGWTIDITTQPAQSPDLNMNDLAFFNSLQSDVSCKYHTKIGELRDSVLEAWREYPAARLESCWRSIYNVYRGILDDNGGHDYKRHGRSRNMFRNGQGDDRSCSAELLAKSWAEFDRLDALTDEQRDKYPSGRIDDDGEGEDYDDEDVDEIALEPTAAAQPEEPEDSEDESEEDILARHRPKRARQR